MKTEAAFREQQDDAVAKISSVDTAATLGSMPISTEVKIKTGSVVWLALIKKIVTGTLSSEVMNENKAPATRPGTMSGRVTSRKASRPFAPSTRAASSVARSTPDRLASAERTM